MAGLDSQAAAAGFHPTLLLAGDGPEDAVSNNCCFNAHDRDECPLQEAAKPPKFVEEPLPSFLDCTGAMAGLDSQAAAAGFHPTLLLAGDGPEDAVSNNCCFNAHDRDECPLQEAAKPPKFVEEPLPSFLDCTGGLLPLKPSENPLMQNKYQLRPREQVVGAAVLRQGLCTRARHSWRGELTDPGA
ncbi:hypothetical protein H920_01953 [Fukomys damarensis]|uniref:Uncharacterized protein n=1 Tax=Fukomys damarensis TaxID=885580 RepID=A0A091E097_FUKDA|nr:hypothetical protein H920_01953 [Fukomys damarensis]